MQKENHATGLIQCKSLAALLLATSFTALLIYFIFQIFF